MCFAIISLYLFLLRHKSKSHLGEPANFLFPRTNFCYASLINQEGFFYACLINQEQCIYN